jgi:hypothetical protein
MRHFVVEQTWSHRFLNCPHCDTHNPVVCMCLRTITSFHILFLVIRYFPLVIQHYGIYISLHRYINYKYILVCTNSGIFGVISVLAHLRLKIPAIENYIAGDQRPRNRCSTSGKGNIFLSYIISLWAPSSLTFSEYSFFLSRGKGVETCRHTLSHVYVEG